MTGWIRSHWIDAGQIAELVDPDAVPAGAAGTPLDKWHAHLIQDGDLVGATMFMAHALQRYECVMWAARSLLETGIADRNDRVMLAVLRWLDDPSDALRRAAGDAAVAIRGNPPEKHLAQAVFLSGGSIAPPDLPPVQPPADVCAKMAAGALIVGACAQADRDGVLRGALALGEAIVTGKAS